MPSSLRGWMSISMKLSARDRAPFSFLFSWLSSLAFLSQASLYFRVFTKCPVDWGLLDGQTVFPSSCWARPAWCGVTAAVPHPQCQRVSPGDRAEAVFISSGEESSFLPGFQMRGGAPLLALSRCQAPCIYHFINSVVQSPLHTPSFRASIRPRQAPAGSPRSSGPCPIMEQQYDKQVPSKAPFGNGRWFPHKSQSSLRPWERGEPGKGSRVERAAT